MPVSAVRTSARTGKADREAARRLRKLSDQESDSATAETASERTEAPPRNTGTEPFPRDVAVAPAAETGRRGWSAPGTAPFVTQVLAQDLEIRPSHRTLATGDRRL